MAMTVIVIFNRWLAQLIEHLLYTQNVIGLNPIPPTILKIGVFGSGHPASFGNWTISLVQIQLLRPSFSSSNHIITTF